MMYYDIISSVVLECSTPLDAKAGRPAYFHWNTSEQADMYLGTVLSVVAHGYLGQAL